jgi:hypothetical protein
LKRSAIKTGRKSVERGSTFKHPRSELERTGGPKRKTRLKQSGPRRRPVPEREIARQWHRLVCAGRVCVRRECSAPAGPFGHHAPRKEWLRRMGLEAHTWDLEAGVPPCERCHQRHEDAVQRITRDDLIHAGYWPQMVAWARDLDARYFPDPVHQPVLSRLESEYPEEAGR